MKKNINEELNYIKYLLVYKKGVVISEQETTPKAPAPATPTQQGGDGCQEFTSVGRFAEQSVDGGQQEIQNLINNIISKPEFKNGATITSIKITGGASNVEKGEQTSWDLDNNYNENPDTKINRGPKYNSNVGYATKRANTAQEPVIKSLAASGINLGAGVTPVIEAKVINTYGATDSKNSSRISSGEVKPGQVVIIKLVVCPLGIYSGREDDDKITKLSEVKIINDIPKEFILTGSYWCNGKNSKSEDAKYNTWSDQCKNLGSDQNKNERIASWEIKFPPNFAGNTETVPVTRWNFMWDGAKITNITSTNFNKISLPDQIVLEKLYQKQNTVDNLKSMMRIASGGDTSWDKFIGAYYVK